MSFPKLSLSPKNTHLQPLLRCTELTHERIVELWQVGLTAEPSQWACHCQVGWSHQGAALSLSCKPQWGIHPAQHLTQVSWRGTAYRDTTRISQSESVWWINKAALLSLTCVSTELCLELLWSAAAVRGAHCDSNDPVDQAVQMSVWWGYSCTLKGESWQPKPSKPSLSHCKWDWQTAGVKGAGSLTTIWQKKMIVSKIKYHIKTNECTTLNIHCLKILYKKPTY